MDKYNTSSPLSLALSGFILGLLLLLGGPAAWAQVPTLSGAAPHGAQVGTSITLTGTTLNGTTAVTVNGTAAPGFVINSATQITFTVPAGATSGLVNVTRPTGTSNGVPLEIGEYRSFAVTTGFTDDVVANGTGVLATAVSSITFDGTNVLQELGYNNGTSTATSGLPGGGFFVGAAGSAPDVPYQLASYSASNALQLTATGASGTLTLAAPQPASALYVLAASGTSITTVDVTVTFTDNSTEAVSGLNVEQWTTVAGSPAITGLGYTARSTSAITSSTTMARLYQYALPLAMANQSKPVRSLSFTKTTAGGTFNVLAVSRLLPQGAPTITGFTPTSGVVGSSITVTGTNLLTATSASVNGGGATIVGTPTATSLTFLLDANSATGPISVTTGSGTVASTGTYTVLLPDGCAVASLVTSYVSNNSNKGEMFDIVATNTVTITCFDLNLILGSNGAYEIYYKPGSYAGYQDNPAAWTLVGSNPSVACVGFDVPSPTNIPMAVTIPAGQTASFYITAINVASTAGIRYTNNGGYTTIASNADLAIAGGIGKAYPFATNYNNRSFNGTVHYFSGPAPTISGFTPTSGGVGTSVTVTGTSLSTATAARVNGTAGTITGTPTATSVTFTVGAGSTTGLVSIATPGGVVASSSNFTVNVPPVLTTSGGSTTWTQGGGPVAVDAALTATDADSPTLTGATVSLTTNFQSSQDQLGFTAANGISGSYVAGTGVLTLSGTATLASYQAALRSITYLNSASTPNTATRTVSFLATDGTLASPAATKTIALTASAIPTITGLSLPAELPGMSVVITGTGFTAASTVTFGGTAASAVVYTSATSLTATVPAGAATGSSTVVVTTSGQSSSSAPAFTVLGVYAGTTSCLATTSYAATGDGAWHYLLTPAGAVVAALQDTRAALGNVSVSFQATGSASAVRQDARSRKYLDRNFRLTASGGNTFTGQTVNLRFYGLVSEMVRLVAADASVSYATLKSTQYSGPNEDCELGNNSATGEHRTLTLTASTPGNGVAWFVAQAAVADHFSEFYLTGSSTPLPVELVAFTAEASDNAVALAWRTASEKNSARFEVERSTDGREFAKVGEVAAQGTKSNPTAYTYLDPLTHLPAYPHALLYYRLRQVDLDGPASYSPMRTVTLGSKELLTLYPNPAHSAVTVGGATAGSTVEVFDALGRVVAQAPADASGTAQLALPTGLAAGVYVVRSGSQAQRLAVE